MSNHELENQLRNGGSGQPDQPFGELDALTTVRAKLMVNGFDGLSADEAALAERFVDFLFSTGFPEDLLPPAPDFPPGLPPKLLELWRQEDEASGNTPPDMSQ